MNFPWIVWIMVIRHVWKTSLLWDAREKGACLFFSGEELGGLFGIESGGQPRLYNIITALRSPHVLCWLCTEENTQCKQYSVNSTEVGPRRRLKIGLTRCSERMARRDKRWSSVFIAHTMHHLASPHSTPALAFSVGLVRLND